MTASDSFIAYLEDVLRALGPITVRRMFGGAGVFADGVMFGLITDDRLYFKADDATRGTFEAEGLGPFTYRTRGRIVALSYWRVPERLLDDPDEMAHWGRQALAAARRAGASSAHARGGVPAARAVKSKVARRPSPRPKRRR